MPPGHATLDRRATGTVRTVAAAVAAALRLLAAVLLLGTVLLVVALVNESVAATRPPAVLAPVAAAAAAVRPSAIADTPSTGARRAAHTPPGHTPDEQPARLQAFEEYKGYASTWAKALGVLAQPDPQPTADRQAAGSTSAGAPRGPTPLWLPPPDYQALRPASAVGVARAAGGAQRDGDGDGPGTRPGDGRLAAAPTEVVSDAEVPLAVPRTPADAIGTNVYAQAPGLSMIDVPFRSGPTSSDAAHATPEAGAVALSTAALRAAREAGATKIAAAGGRSAAAGHGPTGEPQLEAELDAPDRPQGSPQAPKLIGPEPAPAASGWGLQRAVQYAHRVRLAPSKDSLGEQLLSYGINTPEYYNQYMETRVQWLGRVAKLAGQAGLAYVDGDDAKWDRAVNDPAWERYDPQSLARTQQAGERSANAGEAAWAFPAQGVGQHLGRMSLNAWSTALTPFRLSPDKERARQYAWRVWEDATAIAAAAAAGLGLSTPPEPGAGPLAPEQDSRWKSPDQLQRRAQELGGRLADIERQVGEEIGTELLPPVEYGRFWELERERRQLLSELIKIQTELQLVSPAQEDPRAVPGVPEPQEPDRHERVLPALEQDSRLEAPEEAAPPVTQLASGDGSLVGVASAGLVDGEEPKGPLPDRQVMSDGSSLRATPSDKPDQAPLVEAPPGLEGSGSSPLDHLRPQDPLGRPAALAQGQALESDAEPSSTPTITEVVDAGHSDLGVSSAQARTDSTGDQSDRSSDTSFTDDRSLLADVDSSFGSFSFS
jgi:hypothetical protein